MNRYKFLDGGVWFAYFYSIKSYNRYKKKERKKPNKTKNKIYGLMERRQEKEKQTNIELRTKKPCVKFNSVSSSERTCRLHASKVPLWNLLTKLMRLWKLLFSPSVAICFFWWRCPFFFSFLIIHVWICGRTFFSFFIFAMPRFKIHRNPLWSIEKHFMHRYYKYILHALAM